MAISGEYPGTALAQLECSSLEGQSAMLAKCRCGLYYVPASMYMCMYMYMYDMCVIFTLIAIVYYDRDTIEIAEIFQCHPFH